jgi:hypothetical protein
MVDLLTEATAAVGSSGLSLAEGETSVPARPGRDAISGGPAEWVTMPSRHVTRARLPHVSVT